MKEESGRIGSDDYKYIFNRFLFPICKEFSPDLVIVSAGFDAAKGDPLGGMSVEPEAYGYMLKKLRQLADGKLLLALEGGYSPETNAICSVACLHALLDNTSLAKDVSSELDVYLPLLYTLNLGQ